MKVVCAGYNVDAGILSRARGREGEAVTPEVLSAAYARISRDPRGVGALRKEALEAVAAARRSNERIVFGLGHASVAEHAVLNLDVTGISRLAIEAIEHFRLASFTEKSQRYIRLGRDMVVPAEMRAAGAEEEFRALVADLHRAYERTYERIAAAGFEPGSAKEDARYLMPLATATQVGITINGRELEYAIMRLAAHPLAELRSLSRALYRVSKVIIPSLIRYPKPTGHYRDEEAARRELASFAREAPGRGKAAAVRLVSTTPDADRRLAASILFSAGGVSMRGAERAAAALSRSSLDRVLRGTVRRLGPHDAVWREFECVELLFELIVSSSCFAQLKRHRMATIIVQPYDPGLGVSVPESVERAGAAGLLRAGTKLAERFYRRRRRSLGAAAEYALTNAHRRRVLFACNLRELYHFSRLRSDRAAQWEIREISEEMCRLASAAIPVGGSLLAGKDAFEGKKAAFDAHR